MLDKDKEIERERDHFYSDVKKKKKKDVDIYIRQASAIFKIRYISDLLYKMLLISIFSWKDYVKYLLK